jgi:hypothetical protein
MEKTRRFIIIIGMTLVIPALACLSPGLTPPNTPTPTSTVIFAKELQTPGVSTEVPVDREEGCLKTAAGAVNIGAPCIVGTYAAHYDIFQTPNDHETIVTDSLLQAHVSLWAVSVGKLQGTAHLAYSLNSKLTDTKATTCQTQTELDVPFEWDVNLNGQFSKQPDESIQFIILANPIHGPSYFDVFPDCPDIPNRPENGIIWNGLSGKFVQGVFQSVNDNPIPSDATGRFYVETLLQVVK